MISNNDKGAMYEEFVCNKIKETNEAWLWKYIPEQHLVDSKLITSRNEHRLKRKKGDVNPLRDTGVDILQKTNDEYIFVQCKNYKNIIRVMS